MGLLTVVLIAADAQKVYEGYGWRLTAVRMANFSSDDSTSFGMWVNLYEYDGESISYRRKYSTQAFATIDGKWIHRLLPDALHIRSSERLEAEQVFGDVGQIFAHDSLPEGGGLGLRYRWHGTIMRADYEVSGAELFTLPSRGFSDI